MKTIIYILIFGALLTGCAPLQRDHILIKHVGNEDFGYPLLCIAKEYLPAPKGYERNYKLAVVSPAVFEAYLKMLENMALSEQWPSQVPSDLPAIGIFEINLVSPQSKKSWLILGGIETEKTLAELISISEPKRGVPPPEDAAGGIRMVSDYLEAIRAIGRDPRFADQWGPTKRK